MLPPGSAKVDKWMAAIKAELPSFAGRAITDADLDSLVRLAGSSVHKKGPTGQEYQAALASLGHLKGKACNLRLLSRNMQRLVANWHFVSEGMEIPLWDGTQTDADVVFIGVAVKQACEQGRLPSYVVGIKLKTGLGAGIIRCGLLTHGAVSQFLDHESGTASFHCAAEEIAGMETHALVSVENGEMLRIRSWKCSERQKRHNRDLTEHRSDPARCSNPIPCNFCKRDIRECPLAVWLPKPGKEDTSGGKA